MLIVFAEDIININLEKITTALSKTCRDDEPDVVQAVKECVNVIGRFSESETLFAVLVPLVSYLYMQSDLFLQNIYRQWEPMLVKIHQVIAVMD